MKKGLFYKLKYSATADLYNRLFRPEKRKELVHELSFYKSFLPKCRLIFDIGANDGRKTEVFTVLAAKVIACEPDPVNIEILHTRFRKSKQVVVEPVAVSDKEGTELLYIHHPGSELNTLNPGFKTILETDQKGRWKDPVQYSGNKITVKTQRLDSLIEKHGRPDFIKIDVEGSELKVLKRLGHPVPFISFEVLLPEFMDQAQEAIQLLVALDKNTIFNYSVEEKLVLANFLSAERFSNLLPELPIHHLEIIAVTSEPL